MDLSVPLRVFFFFFLRNFFFFMGTELSWKMRLQSIDNDAECGKVSLCVFFCKSAQQCSLIMLSRKHSFTAKPDC